MGCIGELVGGGGEKKSQVCIGGGGGWGCGCCVPSPDLGGRLRVR